MARIVKFIRDCSLRRCDDLFPSQKKDTYINASLKQQSCIDYMLVSMGCNVTSFVVLDPNINFSDHVPLMMSLCASHKGDDVRPAKNASSEQSFLRWDKADRASYYYFTGSKLEPLARTIDNTLQAYDLNINKFPANSIHDFIDSAYDTISSVLKFGGNMFVPERKKKFYKFWWDEELKLLKEASIDSDKLWKAAGKPRHGQLFTKRQSCRAQYRARLRQKESQGKESYTNDLHEALLTKNNTAFWRCWRSQFESRSKCSQVDGSVDPDFIVNKFASHFQKACSCNDLSRAESLRLEYLNSSVNYHGLPITSEHAIDTELVSNVIVKLKHGKAKDINDLTAEHLYYSHPSLCVALAKLFQLMLLCSHVPDGFRHNYIVPVPKPKELHSKSLECNDFRGIAISPIISKVFEHCLLDRFSYFLKSSDNQFGFKKGVGCSFAIRAVRSIVDKIVQGGSTANLCALDMSKAFDKVNHYALFLKLMKRKIPNGLLALLVSWFSECYSCVKWDSVFSDIFRVEFGVRQGSVLSPFCLPYILMTLQNPVRLSIGLYIVLYADDILLLTSSVCQLQRLLKMCEQELDAIDMVVNASKSCCVRIGPRNNVDCTPISMSSGDNIMWVDELRYLGVYIVRSRVFKCSLDMAKKSFYRAANSVFGKIGRIASEEVTLQILDSKCIPVLLYGLEACPLLKSDKSSLDFAIDRFFMKLFKTSSIQIVRLCQSYFNFELPSVRWEKRVTKFEQKLLNSDNLFCKL